MMGFPGTKWGETPSDTDIANAKPAERNWQKSSIEVRHIFTHFELRLTVYHAEMPEAEKPEGLWAPLKNIKAYALPSVMTKVLKAAL